MNQKYVPYAMVHHKLKNIDLELISYPFIGDDNQYHINARAKDDPTTMEKYKIEDLELIENKNINEREAPDGSVAQICKNCNTVIEHKEKCIKCGSTNTTYHHTEIDKALHICNACGMCFYVYGEIYKCPNCGIWMPIKSEPIKENSIFSSGAKRSKDVDKYRYDLISPFVIKALASACREGAEKYPMWNCEKGFPVHDLFNHALGHVVDMMMGDWSEHNIGKIMWGFAMIIHEMHVRPENNIDNHRSEGCKAPDCGEKMWKEYQS